MSLLRRAQKRNGRFLNPVPTHVGGFSTFFKVLPLLLSNRAETEPRKKLGPFTTEPKVYGQRAATGLRLTWFGHSSVLAEIDDFRILLDPVWDQRASPVRWAGPKRFYPPTMPLQDLPVADAVLISHDHYDHLGEATVRKLATMPGWQQTTWVTSLGVAKRLRRFGVPSERLRELDWTESVTLTSAAGARLQVDAWPARHFSGRSLHDRFTTLWSSFVLSGSSRRVFFGADSGIWEGFGEIADRYTGFDVTMLEIGAFHPLWNGIHLGPVNALKAYQAMGGPSRAGLLMPIHWGLFNLALHAWQQPIESIVTSAGESAVPLWIPAPGVPTEVDGPLINTWWQA